MRTKVKTLVLGSGAGGLGAACWLKKKGDLGMYMGEPTNDADFVVVDGCPELPLNLHNGVHYLHTIPELPFKSDIKKITLTDAILNDGKMYDRPSLKFALQYSEKTGESQRPSSIMAVGKEDTAYMPSGNSLNTLLQEMHEYAGKDKFIFGKWLNAIDTEKKIAYFRDKDSDEELVVEYENVISTIPLDKMKQLIDNSFINTLKLDCTAIHVANYKVDRIVPNWMINVYIPDASISIYRASFLNGICSVESTKAIDDWEIVKIAKFLDMFYLSTNGVQGYEWKTGKVVSISTDDRAELIEILKGKDIYQIGRFGLWNRKLLIDSTINQAKAVVEYLNGASWEDIKSILIK